MNDPRYIILFYRAQFLIVDTQEPMRVIDAVASSSKAAELAGALNEQHEAAVIARN